MKWIQSLGLLCLLCVATNSYGTNVWTGFKHITSIEVVETGGFLITFDSIISSVCTAAGTSTLYIYAGKSGLTVDGVKAQLAVAIAAMNTGMQVDVEYDDSTSQCFGRYLQVKN